LGSFTVLKDLSWAKARLDASSVRSVKKSGFTFLRVYRSEKRNDMLSSKLH
jgi:hypothetical protein